MPLPSISVAPSYSPLDNDDCGDAAQIEVSSVVSGTTLTASVPVQISLLFQKDVRAKSLGYRM